MSIQESRNVGINGINRSCESGLIKINKINAGRNEIAILFRMVSGLLEMRRVYEPPTF